MTTTDRTAIFLAGIGIGIAGTLLFAPHEGRETRRRIKRSASDATDFIRQQADLIRDEAAGAARKAVDRVMDRFKDGANRAEQKIEEAGEQLQSA